ncbi:MAG: Jag N-terminal domain-containing protein, partial [Anaerolineales bacterium]|nr:Jag N-terminal domain-containing protein [Anaerolineales bacterium]
MSESRPTLEIIAPSVEEAIAKGLSDLGMTEEEVDVEILDEGSRGLFGLGSRQARIRLSIKSSPSHPEMGATEIPSSVPTKAAISSTDQPTESRVETIKQPPEDSEEDVLSITRETVEELLQKMKV